MIEIVQSHYVKGQDYGDFEKMILSGYFDDSLFIFNDNHKEHFCGHAGKGNAIIRKFNMYSGNKVNAAGVSTGKSRRGGYKSLEESKDDIDQCFREIVSLLETGRYRRVFYSASRVDGVLATNIFKVDREVLLYITTEIYKLQNIQFD